MVLYQPLAEGGAALLARRSPPELEAIRAFIEETLALQTQVIGDLEAQTGQAREHG